MFLELIATFVVGFGAAGAVLILNRITGRRLPRVLLPIAAGGAMIAFTIWSEYNWYPRTVSQLPEGVVVISAHENTAMYRPWTYVAPYVDRFSAIDTVRIRRNPKIPDQVIAPVLFMGRWAPGSEIPVLVDCAESRRADLADGIEFDEDGAVTGADWIEVTADDPIVSELCG